MTPTFVQLGIPTSFSAKINSLGRQASEGKANILTIKRTSKQPRSEAWFVFGFTHLWLTGHFPSVLELLTGDGLMGTWDKIMACKGYSRKSCPRVEATSSLKLTAGSQCVSPGILDLEGVGKVLGSSVRARWRIMCSDPSFCSLLDHSFRGLGWFVGTDLGILKACI